MYKIMSVWGMQEEFNAYGRENYFSDEGLKAIDNYYIDCCLDGGEIGTEVEFDVIAICCDWNEYGNGVVLGFDSLINDFEYLIDDDEDNDEEDKELEEEEKIDVIFKELEDKRYCIRLENGNILCRTVGHF